MSTKKRWIIGIILCIICPFVSVAAILLLDVLLFGVKFSEAIVDENVYLIALCIVGTIVLAVLLDVRFRGARRVLKVNVDMENSHWQTRSEMRRNDGYTFANLSQLSKVNDGIIVSSALGRNNKLNVIFKKPAHTLVIGATRTGKTTSFVSPFIILNAHTKTQPSMIITDPKGELYAQHKNSLAKLGYKVSIIDIDDIFHSTQWNPFGDVLAKTKRLRNLQVTQKSGRYYLDGKEYQTCREAEQKQVEVAQRLENDIYLDIQDLIYAMCTIDSKNEPSWQLAARDFIFGIVLAFWEDVRDGYMPIEKFTLFNLYKTISEYAVGDCEILKLYVETRSSESKVKGLTNTVLVSQDRTLASYLGEVNRYITWLADAGVTALTSGNDLDFSNFDEGPNVLFFKIPEVKESRYKLVALFVQQMYKALIDKATKNVEKGKSDSQKLLRDVYFIMDEFGNLPKLYNIDRIATIGAGRRIFLVPVIQSFSQLENIYGKAISEIVRSNCNIQIFIGTNDPNTLELFSKMCGKKKSLQTSFNDSKDMSVSSSAQSLPLIYPSELEKLNDVDNGVFGNMIVLSLNNYPLKTKMAPIFQMTDIFNIEVGMPEQLPFVVFDENKGFYDVSRTINFILGGYEAKDTVAESVAEAVGVEKGYVEEHSKTVQVFWKTLRKKVERIKAAFSMEDFKTLTESDNLRVILAVLKKAGQTAENKFMSVEIIKVEQFIVSSMERGTVK